MPHQVELIGTGPGQGTLEIPDLSVGSDPIEVAIQRNADDRYLGPGLIWQRIPHWHPCARFDHDPRMLRLSAGAEIVDGVLGSAVNALRIHLRGAGVRATATLRIRGLVGTPARAALAPRGPATAPRVAPPPRDTQRPADPGGPAPQRSKWLPASLLSAGLALSALGLAWQAGLLEGPTPEGGGAVAEPPAASGGPPTAAGTEEQQGRVAGQRADGAADATRASRPGLRGRAFVRDYLAGDPDAGRLLGEAQAREASGDCEAALLLYERAAAADPGAAARVAALHDPALFRATACIAAPQRETALVWYEDAARAGDAPSQRRLGQLLLEGRGSGVLYEEGVDWLRRAAANGDETARQVLDGLGGR
jgi:hypothetical protein